MNIPVDGDATSPEHSRQPLWPSSVVVKSELQGHDAETVGLNRLKRGFTALSRVNEATDRYCRSAVATLRKQEDGPDTVGHALTEVANDRS